MTGQKSRVWRQESGVRRPETADIGLGDKDRAFAELDKAYDDRAGWIMYLKVEPILDPLRSDLRFAELVSRMKFPR